MEVVKKILLLILTVGVGFGGYWIWQKHPTTETATQRNVVESGGMSNPFSQRYSRGKCEGEGTRVFTHPPMKIEDIGSIEPYGIMVDAHVIPTSHGYISPTLFNSPRDSYPVYAIADAAIVNVSHRGAAIGDNVSGKVTDEYQIYFEHSCTFYSYYDLLTSLAPEIERVVGKLSGFEQKQVRIPIKAGELVGRVGGQTVDFAVWNFDKEPLYFVNPDSYDEDRPYLEDMFAYFAEPLRSQLLAKARRTAEPRSGRVDYDIDGRLVGNWFREGSGGFEGPKNVQNQGGGRYWDGHLSISYDYIDPSKIVFSIGNFAGRAAQFRVGGNGPDPASVGMEQGLIKYELEQYNTFKGTALVQLIAPRKLKVETFPDQRMDAVDGFTSQAQIYVR